MFFVKIREAQIIKYKATSKENFTNVPTIDFSAGVSASGINYTMRALIRVGLPFVIKNFVSKDLTGRLKDFESLLQDINDVELPVECYKDSYYDTKSQTTKSMTFGQFLDYINSTKSKERLYLVLDLVNKCRKNLQRTVSASEGTLFEVFNESIKKHSPIDEVNLVQRVLFFGHSTVTEMHYHARQEAILNQVIGEKEIFLFPPGELFYQMNPFPWYHKTNRRSQHCFNATNSYDFEKLAQIKNLTGGFRAALAPGDSLYIPIYWWHIVFGTDLSMSFAEFYDSSFRKKYLTRIGLRTRNHIPFYRG